MNNIEYKYMNNTKVNNTKLITFNIKVPSAVSSITRPMGFKDLECLNVVVCNLISCIKKKSVLVYSRHKDNKVIKRNNRKGITTRRVIRAVEFLESIGYITSVIGNASKNKENRIPSVIIPTSTFTDMWADLLVEETSNNYLETCKVMELRSNGMEVGFNKTDETDEIEKVVRFVNATNEKHTVKDAEGNELTNIYCRIFQDDFTKGGRWYRADVLGIKNKDNERLGITIDDLPVVEVDYSNMHIRMIAIEEGLDMLDYKKDMYASILQDEKNVVDRMVVKKGLNIMINAENEKTAMFAIQSVINNLSDEEKAIYTLGNAKSIIALVLMAYPHFRHCLLQDKHLGLRLQNADSRIAASVLEKMVEMNTPCLPIHDSFIVKKEDMEFLIETMAEKFREVMYSDYVVPMKVKWKENGVIYGQNITR